MIEQQEQRVYTNSDRKHFEQHGLTANDVSGQIEQFKNGKKYLNLARPCTIGDGIIQIQDDLHDELIENFEIAQASGRMQKFVPASGAATRMFKALLELMHDTSNDANFQSPEKGNVSDIGQLFDRFPIMAFYDKLNAAIETSSTNFSTLHNNKDIKTILEFLLTDKGLNFSNLPKLLIPFHKYATEIRTPFDEHLIEALAYVRSSGGITKLHFTISPQHEDLFLIQKSKALETYKNGIQFDISHSFQKPKTDTIAVDFQFELFRSQNNSLVFRPGGHGALIENINDLRADIVFIKNVDNILPDHLKEDEIKYKKVLGGFLLQKEKEIFALLTALDGKEYQEQAIENGLIFISKTLQLTIPESVKLGALQEKERYIRSVLDRPIRVCGMVKNEGDPGGGPFWVEHKNGTISKQIVEQVQINKSEPAQVEQLHKSTHFNPVDLVCSVRDYRGNPFNLKEFVDNEAGFISKKSMEGRDLLALELPGLWNGAMAFWTTFFVEMPTTTFNPVKTVFDLLRPEHSVGTKQ